MKKIGLSIVCLLTARQLFAQDCSQLIYPQKGKIITTTIYDINKNVRFKIVGTVSNVVTQRGTTTGTVISETFGTDGRSIGKRNLIYKCAGGTFMMDVNSDYNQVTKTENRSPSLMAFPAGMTVGQHFKEEDIDSQSTNYGVAIATTNKITDKQVVAKESATTPAGTWTALKITYNLCGILKGAHPLHPEIDPVTVWYVPNFGIVQYQIFEQTIKITSIK